MPLGNSKHKLYFLDVNINRLIQYDNRWPDIEVSPWSVSELAWIYCLSTKLGLPSPIPQLPLINEDAKDKFGWEGSKNFVKVLQESKQLSSKAPESVPLPAMGYVIQELDQLASKSLFLEGL